MAERSIERAVRVLRTLARKYQVPLENPEGVGSSDKATVVPGQ